MPNKEGSFKEVNQLADSIPKGEFTVTIRVVNPDKWDRFLDIENAFMAKFKELFMNCVFETHRYLIRITPMRTGRLRGGWVSILDKYNQDYTRAFYDVSLLHIPSDSPGVLDAQAIMDGVRNSSFLDLYPDKLDVTLINQVSYGEYVEWGTSKMEGQNFTNRAMYKAEHIIAEAFDKWLKDITNAGDIVEPRPVEEVTA